MEDGKGGCGRVRVGIRETKKGRGGRAVIGVALLVRRELQQQLLVAGVERSPSASPAASPETRAAELEPGWDEGSEGWGEGEDGDSAPVRKRPRGAG